MSSGADLIYWCPPDARCTARGTILRRPFLRHHCPSAVIVAFTSRDALDPMALGVCRYCREPLPTRSEGRDVQRKDQ